MHVPFDLDSDRVVLSAARTPSCNIENSPRPPKV